MSRPFEDGPAPPYGPHLLKEIQVRCPEVFLVCFRDKNKNVMVYQARVQHGEFMDPPLDAYWLILEPNYQKARQEQGIRHDREEQGLLDRQFAWGFHQNKLSPKVADFSFAMAPDHKFKVRIMKDGSVKAFHKREGRVYVARSLFIAASENLHLINIHDNVKTLYMNATDVTDQRHPQPARVYLKGS